MENFEEIVSAYSGVDATLDERIKFARRSGDPIHALQEQQQKTARAYFLLLWAEFEAGLDRKSRTAIDSGKSRRWRQSRSWQVLDSIGMDRLPLLERAALVIDKNTHDYRDIKEKYQLRNELAHGVWPNANVDLYREADDFRQLYERLDG